MRIWIDFINTPQVSFFDPLINDLMDAGHEFVLTCRDSANTVDLIKQRNWPYTIIGTKAEKSTIRKCLSFPVRIRALYNFLKNQGIDVAICQSSFYLPLTAKFLGIPSIYTNDNEHALGNIPSFLFATKIFIPENLSLKKVTKQGASINKTTQYPGIKEGIYLWKLGDKIYENRSQKNNKKVNIYIRPEPLTAQYYKGGLNFLDDALIALQSMYSITVLPRDKNQSIHYTQAKFSLITVPEKVLEFSEIANDCSLFIGAGGSMTREMAILGIPTISVYQDQLLDVDTFLIKKELMSHEPEINSEKIIGYIDRLLNQEPNPELLIKGKDAYNFFKSELLKFTKK